jgi:hypothetical protein
VSAVVAQVKTGETWGGRNPSATMYEAGSVFHFKYQGTLQTGSMEQMAEEGIGIRTNEGFGQVIFLGSYEKAGCNGKQGITPEQRGSAPEKTDGLSRQEKDTLRLIAKAYYRQQLDRAMEQYILKHPLSKGSESRSRLGILESFATAYRYHPDDGIRLIKEFYTHAEEKERKQTVHQERGSMEKIKEHVKHVLEKELETFLEVDIGKRGNIMGFPKAELLTEEEQKRVKLEFLTREIRFENKEVH